MKSDKATLAIAAALIVTSLLAQAQKGPTPPDISGAWERYGFNLGQPTTDGQRRDGTIPPRSEQPVVKPAYQKAYQDRLNAVRDANTKGAPLASNYVDCLGDGMPLMMQAMFPIEFLQSPGQVTVIEEAFTQVRRIKLDKPQKKIDDVEPGFYGHSVGHWEGDTLMVDTIGVKESIRYNNLPHSDQMRIKEKIHLASPTVLWDEITIEDPVVLEKPFTIYYAYRRMADYTLLEYICEDNREFKDANGVQQIRVGDSGKK
jgi:hypothetical protein